MKTIYLDCFSGISGNMMIGALLDAGVPANYLKTQLEKLKLPDEYTLIIEHKNKNGINATYFNVELGKIHTSHRTLIDIKKLITASSLFKNVQDVAISIFEKLAEAEGKVHGATTENVHFHEVGAIDAIIDIVGTVICLDYLSVRDIFVRNLHTGIGFINCAHGIMPVPTPATAELLKGFDIKSGTIEKELVTPTGAAIINTLAKKSTTILNFSYDKIAYGAGSWDLTQPNVLRIYLKDSVQNTNTTMDDLVILKANIDDMSPQIFDYVSDKLFSAKALDVWVTPIIMKKGRPGHMLSVLLRSENFDTACDIIFHETTTLGIRVNKTKRISLNRDIRLISTAYGLVHCKIARYKEKICNISAEYDDCKQIAAEKNIPIRKVQDEALRIAYYLAENDDI